MNQLKDTLRVFVVPTEILDAELDIYEKMTYMVLRSYANGQDDTAFPSYATIAKKGSMGRKKAIECVKKLIELGLVVKEKRKKVSNDGGISDTSNLYTIYRPAEIQKKEVVSEKHYPSVQQTPPLVSEKHYPSVQQTPEKNYLKELDLKESFNSVCSEEAEILSLLEERSDIGPHTHTEIIKLLNIVKTRPTFKHSIFVDTLNLVDFEIDDMSYFKAAIKGNLKKGYVRPAKESAPTGSARKEVLPNWFEEKQKSSESITMDPAEPKQNATAKKQEIEDMLKKLRA